MSEARLLACALLLSGGMAAAVAAATLRYGVEPPPRIAGVRLAEITAAYTTRAATEGRTSEEVRAWGAALEAALDHVPDIPWLGLKGPLVGPQHTDRAPSHSTILPHAHDGPAPVEAAR